MALRRRAFLQLAAGAAALPVLPRAACALGYPARPIRIIVGFAPGGAPDIITRVIAEWLTQRLGQPFVIENRPGAGTNLATETVAKAPADGYTLLAMVLPGTVSSPILYRNTSFNVLRDIQGVASINTNPFVMVVAPSFPAQTVPEFIAYAKANRGKINIASTGTGNLTYLSAELFKMMAGLDMVQVPARSEGEAQTDLFSGRAEVLFDPLINALDFIRSGKMRALGLTGAKRLDSLLPGLPAIGEFVTGYDVDGFLGIGAPAGTASDIVTKLNQTIGQALADPAVDKHLSDLGCVQVTMSPAEFQKRIGEETEKWRRVIGFAGLKAD